MVPVRQRIAVHAAPFAHAEEAWFWAMAVMLARQDGAALGWRPDELERPAEPEDVVACCDRLYREGSLSLAQARLLRRCGELQRPPPRLPERDNRLWQQAMAALEWTLRARGIVA